MHSRQPIRLNHQLDIVRDSIASIRVPVLIRLIRNLKQAINLLLIQSHATRYLRQPLVRLIPRLVDGISVEEIGLPVEQRPAKLPELVRMGLEYCGACFVDERGRGMPGLDLLSEDELDFLRVLLLHHGEDGVVDCHEHLLAERADIVEEELESVRSVE